VTTFSLSGERSGPNRLTTAFARRWACAGVPSLRLDLRGIGDSDGDPFEGETPHE
jgi:alpha/beta superfamily hydrolase